MSKRGNLIGRTRVHSYPSLVEGHTVQETFQQWAEPINNGGEEIARDTVIPSALERADACFEEHLPTQQCSGGTILFRSQGSPRSLAERVGWLLNHIR